MSDAEQPIRTGHLNLESLTWAVDQLADALDQLLPHLQRYARIPAAQGGPAADQVSAGNDGEVTLRGLEQAETILFQIRAMLPREGDAAPWNPPIAEIDLLETEPAGSGDPLIDAARALIHAHERVRARGIVGEPVGPDDLDQLERARAALLATARGAESGS